MPEINNITAIPTGGAIGMELVTAAGNWTLSRAISVSGSPGAFVEISSGTQAASGKLYHLDTGDGLPTALPPTNFYIYQLTDTQGSVQSVPVEPVSSVEILQSNLDQTMIRLMQGGIDSMQLPEGIGRAKVSHAMPLTGFPPLPFLVVYEELLQQEEVPIGGDISNPDPVTGIATFSNFARRLYRVTVLSQNPQERKFYRDAVIAFFKVWLATFFSAIGSDLRQKFIATSYQVSGDTINKSPGFFGCDIALEITGTLNVAVVTTYGIINEIIMTATESSFDNGPTVIDTIEWPLS
jgi:hypothetical protein